MYYTARYANKKLKEGNFTCVRISIGTPKWRLPYQLKGEVKEIMPWGMLKITDIKAFRNLYYNALDKYGVNRIRESIDKYKESGKIIVLLCYEDIRKGPEEWCHRRVFADWWELRTGEKIEELPEVDEVMPKHKKNQNRIIEEINLF